MAYKQPKRDIVRYGRKIQAKLSYRETTAGSNCWGPWKQQEFPINGECETKRHVTSQILEYLVNEKITSDDIILALAFTRKKQINTWLLAELLKKDISLKELIFKDFKEWKLPPGE